MTIRPKWKVDTTSMPGVIRCVMAGVVDVDEMKDFVAAHNWSCPGFVDTHAQ
jgi:hypothetical protein